MSDGAAKLSSIFESSGKVMAIREGPQGQKEIQVSFLFRKEDLGNYKPISITLICGKADGANNPGKHLQKY